MPSSPASEGSLRQRRRGKLSELLHSQGLGVACGLLTVVLLGVGSVVLAATHDGASRGVQLDDIRVFFEQPSIWHLWFYLLIPVLGLYGLNTLLCTWETTLRRLRAGKRAPWHHGPALIHLSFLLLLLAHLIGGLWSQGGRPFVLDGRWRMLGDGRDARVLTLKIDRHPSGQPRQVRARLELWDGQRTWSTTVAYNRPLVSDGGAQLWLLVTYRHRMVATIKDGEDSCSAAPRGVCSLTKRRVFVMGLRRAGGLGVARVLLLGKSGRRSLLLAEGRPARLADGSTLELLNIKRTPTIALRRRQAPGNPLALASVLLLIGGVLSMGRRWWQ
jgi:hypothetical protein